MKRPTSTTPLFAALFAAMSAATITALAQPTPFDNSRLPEQAVAVPAASAPRTLLRKPATAPFASSSASAPLPGPRVVRPDLREPLIKPKGAL